MVTHHNQAVFLIADSGQLVSPNVQTDPLGEENAAAVKAPTAATPPWGQNVVAKAEPSPAIIPRLW